MSNWHKKSFARLRYVMLHVGIIISLITVGLVGLAYFLTSPFWGIVWVLTGFHAGRSIGDTFDVCVKVGLQELKKSVH